MESINKKNEAISSPVITPIQTSEQMYCQLKIELKKIEVSESGKSVHNQFVILAHHEQISFVKTFIYL